MTQNPTPPRGSRAAADRLDLLLALLFSLVFIGVIAAGTMWFSVRSREVLTEDKRADLQTRATLAAMQFSAEEIAMIQDLDDATDPLFTELVERAERIRASVPDLDYVYIMRRTEDPLQLAFVIENDMLLTPEEQDTNENGVIEEDEMVPVPGDLFAIADIPALQDEAFESPTSDESITYDQWGAFMSGYAPITDESGVSVAVIGLDMRAERFMTLTSSILSPAVSAVVILGCLPIAFSFFFVSRRRRLRLLQRVDAQRRAMVQVASHKLGGPIASIRWSIESLSDSSSMDAEARKELTNAAERLSDVTKNLEEATNVDGADMSLWQKLAQETAKEIQAHGGAKK